VHCHRNSGKNNGIAATIKEIIGGETMTTSKMENIERGNFIVAVVAIHPTMEIHDISHMLNIMPTYSGNRAFYEPSGDLTIIVKKNWIRNVRVYREDTISAAIGDFIVFGERVVNSIFDFYRNGGKMELIIQIDGRRYSGDYISNEQLEFFAVNKIRFGVEVHPRISEFDEYFKG
jgi:hypothetical protein